MTDDAEAALLAETRNKLVPADQRLANMLLNKHVKILDPPGLHGIVSSWTRRDDRIELTVMLDPSFQDYEPFMLWIDEVELYKGSNIYDEANAAAGAGDFAPLQEIADHEGWEADSRDVAEHGRAVGVTVTTMDGKLLGAWNTHEDGTHVKLDVRACRVCGCTDDHACDGGCSWVEADLCSVCQVAEQAQKGTRKLISDAEEFKAWKKDELPWLLEQIDLGYTFGARIFRWLNEDQLDAIVAKRPAMEKDRWMVNSEHIARLD